MEEQQIVEEVIGLFQTGLRHFEKELRFKEKEYDKIVISFSELTLVPVWRQPLKPLLKIRNAGRAEKLKRQILILKERIKKIPQAIDDLKQGTYLSAIPLFNPIADIFYRPSPPSGSVSFFVRHNQKFFHILDLERQLIDLQEKKE